MISSRTLTAAVVLAAIFAGNVPVAAGSQDVTATMAIYFDENFLESSTNTNVIGSGIPMYLVLWFGPADGIHGFEGQIRGADGLSFGTNAYVLDMTFPPEVDAVLQGSFTNYKVYFQDVLPANPNGLLLARWMVMFFSGGSIELGPNAGPAIPGVPSVVLADGQTDLPCGLPYGAADPDGFARVATVGGAHHYPTGYDMSIAIPGANQIIAGTFSYATDGYDDQYDLPSAPGSLLVFPRPEWNIPDMTDFRRDIRSLFNPQHRTKVWYFTARTEVPDTGPIQIARLDFRKSTYDPLPGDLHLYDRRLGVTVPLQSGQQYQYLVAQTETRAFDLVVGRLASPERLEVAVGGFIDELHDGGVLARTAPEATDDWDGDWDIPKPGPPPSDYVHVSFLYPDWPLGPYFLTDTRASFDIHAESRSWPLRVETDRAGEVTLRFEPNVTPNSGIALLLHDLATGEVVNLLPDLTYRYEAAHDVRLFELSVGGPFLPVLQPASRRLAAGWSLTGLPLDPPAGATLDDVILGAAPSFAYAYTLTGEGSYEHLEPSTAADRRLGYWIATAEPYDWVMPGEPSYTELVVPVRSGWHLLGYPLWFPASLAGLQVRRDGVVRDWEQAVNLGLVSGTVYGFDSALAGYVEATSFEAWQGYWLRAYAEDLELIFDWRRFQTAPPLARVVVEPAAARTQPQPWSLALTLEAHDGASRQAVCGVHPEAAVGFDPRHDKPEPPPSPAGEPLRLGIVLDAGDPGLDRLYRQKLLPSGQDRFAWDLELAAVQPGRHTLTWERQDWPGDLDLELRRVADRQVLVASLRTGADLVLDLGPQPLQLRLQTSGGDGDLPELPILADRLSAAPNPFNPQTALTIDLTAGGAAEIAIYNVRGQRVGTLDLGTLAAGRHQATWLARDREGRDLPSGVYFAALQRDGARVGGIIKLSLVR